MALFQRTCRDCSLYASQQSACMLTRQPTSPQDYCSKLRTHLEVCELCHRPTLEVIVVPPGHTLCSECGSSLSSCQLCGNHSCTQQIGYCDKFKFIWEEELSNV